MALSVELAAFLFFVLFAVATGVLPALVFGPMIADYAAMFLLIFFTGGVLTDEQRGFFRDKEIGRASCRERV